MRVGKILFVLMFLIVTSISAVSAENLEGFFKSHIHSTVTIWIGAEIAPAVYGMIVDAQDDFIVIDVNGRKVYISIEYISRWMVEKKK
jgi:hypothetical protein